jgi:hypothetical protein
MITLLNQWGIGQNEVYDTPIYPLSRWSVGQVSVNNLWKTNDKNTCLLFGGVSISSYICIHIISI